MAKAIVMDYSVDVLQQISNFVLAGCYYFDSKTKQRLGGFQLIRNDNKLLPFRPTDSGIYDFVVTPDLHVFAATASGIVEAFHFTEEAVLAEAWKSRSLNPESPVDTANRPHITTGITIISHTNGLAAVTGDGFLAHVDKLTGQLIECRIAHEAECWAVESLNSAILFTGGDDFALRSWDVRQGLGHPGPANTRSAEPTH